MRNPNLIPVGNGFGFLVYIKDIRRDNKVDGDNGKNFKKYRADLNLFEALARIYEKDGGVDFPLCWYGLDQLTVLGESYRNEVLCGLEFADVPTLPFPPPIEELVDDALFSCFENGTGDNLLFVESGLDIKELTNFQYSEHPVIFNSKRIQQAARPRKREVWPAEFQMQLCPINSLTLAIGMRYSRPTFTAISSPFWVIFRTWTWLVFSQAAASLAVRNSRLFLQLQGMKFIKNGIIPQCDRANSQSTKFKMNGFTVLDIRPYRRYGVMKVAAEFLCCRTE